MNKRKKYILLGVVVILFLGLIASFILWEINKDAEPIQPKNFHAYLKKAINGDTKAQTMVGGYYLDGYYINPDYSEAKYWLKLASKGGSKQANYSLCNMYSLEGILPRDNTKTDVNNKKLTLDVNQAIKYCSSGKYYYMLGNMFYKLKNYTSALKYFYLGKNYFELSRMYFFGQGVEQDYKKAFYFLQKVVNRNFENSDLKDGFSPPMYYPDAQSLYILATTFEGGIGTTQNHNKALHYYFLAAQSAGENANEANEMKSVIKRLKREHSPYLRDVIATQSIVTNSYDFGMPALIKLAEFADQKDIHAIALLGSLGILYGKCYSSPNSPLICPISIERLHDLLEFAAEQGSPLAQYVLGKAIIYNWGLNNYPSTDPTVITAANNWFEKAAQQGSLLAQISICNNEYSSMTPQKMYAWCKVVLANKSKFPSAYKELTIFKNSSISKGGWLSINYTNNMLGTLSRNSNIVKDGERLFKSYWEAYGNHVFEEKSNDD